MGVMSLGCSVGKDKIVPKGNLLRFDVTAITSRDTFPSYTVQ